MYVFTGFVSTIMLKHLFFTMIQHWRFAKERQNSEFHIFTILMLKGNLHMTFCKSCTFMYLNLIIFFQANSINVLLIDSNINDMHFNNKNGFRLFIVLLFTFKKRFKFTVGKIFGANSLSSYWQCNVKLTFLIALDIAVCKL